MNSQDIANKLANMIAKFGTNPQSSSFASRQDGMDYYNIWADFWRYEIGVNVIPADTKRKVTYIKWTQWQDKPIPEGQHSQWKSENAFENGMAVVLGRTWHRQNLSGYYLVGLDADNRKAIKEICTRNGITISLKEFVDKTLVEQHKDNQNKAHFYFYTTRPIKGKGSDQNTLGDKISSGEVPAIEIKSLGSHGLLYCSPSVHKNGYPYEIIGTKKPATLNDRQTNELEIHLDMILTKYGIAYQSASSTHKVTNTNSRAV